MKGGYNCKNFEGRRKTGGKTRIIAFNSPPIMPVKSNLKEFFVLLYQANRGVKKHINASTCHGIPTTLSPSSTYFAGLCLKFPGDLQH